MFARIISCAAVAALLSACASTQTAKNDSPAGQDQAVGSEAVSVLSPTSMRMWVDGLGCPMCATNVDLALSEVDGVKGTRVDLETGEVLIEVEEGATPDERRLVEAVRSTGMTLRNK